MTGSMCTALRFEMGVNFSYFSAPPLSAYVGGIDFNGDGTQNDLLPGTTVNAINRGLGRQDLQRLVSQSYATFESDRDSRAALLRCRFSGYRQRGIRL